MLRRIGRCSTRLSHLCALLDDMHGIHDVTNADWFRYGPDYLDVATVLEESIVRSRMRIALVCLASGVLLELGGCLAGPLATIFFAVGPFPL